MGSKNKARTEDFIIMTSSRQVDDTLLNPYGLKFRKTKEVD